MALQELCRVEIRRVLRQTAQSRHPDIMKHVKVTKSKKSTTKKGHRGLSGQSSRNVTVSPFGMMLGT